MPTPDVQIVQPAQRPAEPPKPHVLVAGVGAGLGAGGAGIAGSALLDAEVWPLRFLGFGLEGAIAGSRALQWSGFTDTRSLEALVGRASYRHAVTPRLALTGSLLFGAARVHGTSYSELPPVPCVPGVDDDESCGYPTLVTTKTNHRSFTWGLEAGLRFRLGPAEGALLARFQLAEHMAIVTIGPWVGFGL